MNYHYHFNYARSAALPRLAWCLQINAGSTVANVTHGDWLETSSSCFFEGAWAGEFEKNSFDAEFMTGTGGKLISDGLLLVTPNHTLDRLNVLRKNNVLYVSNSLPYVLAASGEELDSHYPYYDGQISSIKFGLTNYQRTILTRSNTEIYLHYACNLLINDSLELIARRKAPSPAFLDFAHYKSYLSETTDRIARNASDSRRKVTYLPVATVSRGYDSPAAMAIAKQVGCREAFTFRRFDDRSVDEDNGTIVAEAVGISVREFDRLGYCKRDDFPEILNSGGPNEFLSFGDNLTSRLVFTGFHGDKIWDKNCDKVSHDLVRGDASGSSLTEFRLQSGFCHLPIPFIGGDSHPSIHKVSNSPAMSNWSLRNSYDRPIPRRIAEEEGVPRHAFGHKKRAAGVVVSRDSLALTMSKSSLTDFEHFTDMHRAAISSVTMRCMQVVKKLSYLNHAASRFAARILSTSKLKFLRVPILVPRKLEMLTFGYLGKEAYLFHWGVAKLVERYNTALKDLRSTKQ